MNETHFSVQHCLFANKFAILVQMFLLASCVSLPSKPGPQLQKDPCPAVDNETPLPQVIAEMVYFEQPIYPRLAEQAGLEGTVKIKALVGNDGSVLDAIISTTSGTPAFDEAARAAAPRCRFKPAVRDGRPVCMWVTYIVNFKLDMR